MTRDEFVANTRIEEICVARGIHLIGSGSQRKAKCPFHDDKVSSLSVNTDTGLWKCFAGCGGGGVIDLMMKLDGLSFAQFAQNNGINVNGDKPKSVFQNAKPAPPPPATPSVEKTIECTYSYRNALGDEVYQVVRYKPKTFRQRRPDGKGGWIWNLQGIERVIYNLPDVIKSQKVVLVEGEKDSDNLTALGYVATTSVGGADSWLDAYGDTFKDKDVTICGDNDKPNEKGIRPGDEYKRKVFDCIAGKAKSVKMIRVPETVKDISDFIATFKSKEDARKAIDALIDEAHPFVQGIRMPIYTVGELQPRLIKHFQHHEENAFYLDKWLPGLNKVGPIIPGDLVVLLGDTGGYKSCFASGIAFCAIKSKLPTIFFELELSPERLLTRLISTQMKANRHEIRNSYINGFALSEAEIQKWFQGLFICTESRLTIQQIEEIIFRSELKIGTRPKLVILDYLQLIQGKGERYERTSDAMEALRVVAKSTQTIIILLSQVHRPKEGEKEISKYSGKESGSIENSASLLLGVWVDIDDKTCLHVKVLKNNEGAVGTEILCNVNGETMTITERAQEFEPPKQKTGGMLHGIK